MANRLKVGGIFRDRNTLPEAPSMLPQVAEGEDFPEFHGTLDDLYEKAGRTIRHYMRFKGTTVTHFDVIPHSIMVADWKVRIIMTQEEHG